MKNDSSAKKIDSQLEPILRSLRRLILCNRLREYADYPEPISIKDISGCKELLLAWVVKFVNNIRIRKNMLARFILAPFIVEPFTIITLRFILYKKNNNIKLKDCIKSIRNIILSILKRIYYYDSISSEVNCFIHTTDKEYLKVRYCSLLYTMGRYGEAVEQLVKVFLAGRNNPLIIQWLSHFLAEIADMRAAEEILTLTNIKGEDSNYKGKRDFSKSSPTLNRGTRSHQYAILISSMSDSPVFRSSLMSLLESDFQGKIVVVEDGMEKGRACEKFCNKLSVKYIKLESHSGPAECWNVGIQQLDLEIDMIILAHNDILWPKNWFNQLFTVWDEIYDYNKVGLINLGYFQFYSKEEALKELFVRRGYDDLMWILKKLTKNNYLINKVQDVQVEDMRKKFGLAYDPWNTEFDKCRFMIGRFSVAVSFPREIWTNIGGFSPRVLLADLELQNYCMQKKIFVLWINNIPLIHCRSSDTHNLEITNRLRFRKMEAETYDYFNKIYGWQADHFLSTLFAETYVIYSDEIIKAANELRFSDADFIFDYFDKRLKNKRRSNCENVVCRNREKCKY